MLISCPCRYLSPSVRSVTRCGAGELGPPYTVFSGWIEKPREPPNERVDAPAAPCVLAEPGYRTN